MKYSFLTILVFFSIACFAQSNVLSDFRENHSTALSLYFYPSTLRMINLDRNEEFDEMIRDIKRARFFKMDSGAVSDSDLSELKKELENQGFEEVMFVKNKDADIQVWCSEKGDPMMVVISKLQEDLMLMEINGMINITKIPKLAQTFSQNSFLDVLNLKEK